MKEEYIYVCPFCKADISEMSVTDSIGHLNSDDYGTLYLYRCPHCKRTFSDLEIECKKLTKE